MWCSGSVWRGAGTGPVWGTAGVDRVGEEDDTGFAAFAEGNDIAGYGIAEGRDDDNTPADGEERVLVLQGG